ncbi:type II secretion system F family protein [Defluviimonas salinarum]|uniref:Type II secretion system F family protein n=1 Tax=Defluviimonas salinarum TaxID=2992147 RepID=A0ABT3J532_9RHOB|nr:type II secretion system F family protein [Defluviimonas salinarum]MCW3782575.1 type II secretion system F family protein [Defluviimonas salinarum]
MIYKPTNFEKKVAKFQFGYKARTDMYNQLIALLGTGMPKTDAIQMSWDVASMEGKKPKEAIAIVLQDIIQGMKNGLSLGQAMKAWVPQEDVMVFEAIENSDDFVANLKEYLEMLEKKKKIKSTISGGLAYPAVLVLMVYGIMTYFGKNVVPQIAQLLPIEKWQGAAKFLTFMYNFANHYAIPTVVVFLTIVGIIMASLPRWADKGRGIADKMPIYSTYRMYTGISFLMSMASLIQGGMPAVQAIDRLRPSATPYVAHRLFKVRNQMLNGNNFGAALYKAGTGWPDQKMNLNIKIFAETQDLSAQLAKLSKSWIDVAQANISKTMAVLRTAAMMMVFLTIMGIVGGVYALQDQIATSVQSQ